MPKTINVFITLPDNANFIACNSDGRWFWFETEPYWNEDSWRPYDDFDADFGSLQNLLPHYEPKNSLQSVVNHQLRVQLCLPNEANFMACDKDGSWWWYIEEPIWDNDFWMILLMERQRRN